MSDPEKKPVETPAAWIRFADENLAVAEREMASDDPAHHTVCFLVVFEINRRMLRHPCPLPKPGCQGSGSPSPAFEENAARTAEEVERSEILHCLSERRERV